jgi:hypothetical protein
MSLISELNRRNVFRVATAYIIASWLLIQVAETIFPLFGFDNTPARIVVIILAIGFIPTVILSWVYELTSTGFKRDKDVDRSKPSAGSNGRTLDFIIIGLLAIALVVITVNWIAGGDERWARDVAIPQVEGYVDAGDWEAAYQLGKEIEERVPDDPNMAQLWGEFSWVATIPSIPPGATVYRRPYSMETVEWEELGQTPLNDIHFPFGLSIIRLELDDRPPVFRMLGGTNFGGKGLQFYERRPYRWFGPFAPEPFIIDPVEALPEQMVRVPGWSTNTDDESTEFNDFFIGRFEVTNREFKTFMDAGGYQNRDLWQHEFTHQGSVIPWEEAMSLFVDKSGRQGPATWEAGSYPDGQGDHPVAGVSWYEAAAYARFAGFELPTYQHWRRAIADGALPWMLPASNLDGTGTSPVTEHKGISWTGAYDMAGNVREWCSNSVDSNRVILGGGWNDSYYVVHESILDESNLPPLDRSSTNGIRLAHTSDDRSKVQYLRDNLPPIEKIIVGEPVSDDVYAALLNNFNYDPMALNATLERTESNGSWTREYITFDASYGDERVGLYLYLPNSGTLPYQTIVYWGGTGWMYLDSIEKIRTPLEFALKNGLAVAVPVLKGTFDRRVKGYVSWATLAGRDIAIQQVKDFRRVIDYLETRDDIDSNALAYFGRSWGGRVGAIVLAVENRIKVGVLDQAGLQHLGIPEINVVNYLPRINVPVLQFNGIYDTDFRFETSAKPFFELIGTDQADKKHVAEATGHFVPELVVSGETLNWLDKYLARQK